MLVVTSSINLAIHHIPLWDFTYMQELRRRTRHKGSRDKHEDSDGDAQEEEARVQGEVVSVWWVHESVNL